MLKSVVLLIALTFLFNTTQAQHSEITGVIRDTTANSVVDNAVVAILSSKDSVLLDFARTNSKGEYKLNKIAPGNFIIMVMHPSFADFVEDIEVTSPTQRLSPVDLTSKSKILENIIVQSGSPMRIKGDTTIYTADSFKVSANANVEELLKKMPGFQVDKDGTIKQMGQTVEKVLVDGEEFFGDDPGMAVKNLRADAVKEVQVFDKKSDQAEFTGIDDGNTKKTINLKLKEDKKKGYFGKISLAGGLMNNIDNRYNNNLLLSSFKGKRKISGFFLQGNTGQDGLSWQDSEKFGGDEYSMSMNDDGDMMFMWNGGGSDDEPYVNTQNGFIKNINAGIQYSNKWNEKTTLNFSPKFNLQDYRNSQLTLLRTQVSPDTVYYDNTVQNSHINRNNFKSTATYEIKLDSSNTLKLTARANFYHTESETYNKTTRQDIDNELMQSSEIFNNTNSNKHSISGSVLFKHKFKKARRTFSINSDYSILKTEGTNFIKSNYESLSGIPVPAPTDRMVENDRQTQMFSNKLIYTEPLSTRYSLELSTDIGFNTGLNNRITSNYDNVSLKYSEVVDTLSNDFKQNITTIRPSVKINYSFKKMKFNFGSGVGFTNFSLLDKTYDKKYDRSYTNFFPSASLTYSYKSNHSLRVNYSGSTRQPTIDQLQPLRNADNEFYQTLGNPDLKPSFTNSLSISHNSYDFLKDMWAYQSLSGSITSNSITNSRTYTSVKTISQPINTNGNINARFYGGIGFKAKKINTRFNFNVNTGYYRYADMINNVLSFSQTVNSGIGFYISKSKDKKYDISVGNDFGFNVNKSNQSLSSYKYNSNNLSADATIYYQKVWSIQSDYNFFYRGKLRDTDENLNNNLWNAKLQRTFKSNEYTVFFQVRDILNQNIGIERNFSGNTYREVTNDRLKRYFLLGFSWDFKNKGSKPSPTN